MGVCPKTENACLFRWAWMSEASSLILGKAFVPWPTQSKNSVGYFSVLCVFNKVLVFHTEPRCNSHLCLTCICKDWWYAEFYCGTFSQGKLGYYQCSTAVHIWHCTPQLLTWPLVHYSWEGHEHRQLFLLNLTFYPEFFLYL